MSRLTDKALQLLEGAEQKLKSHRGVVGLDGFVDQIIRIVDKRQTDGTATFVSQIPEFGRKVQAATGKSTKFELSVQQVKLGGNGVIMANAMARLGLPLSCLGNLGFPDLHPVFQPMKAICEMISVAEPSYTDALEFDDGKLMLSRQESAGKVTWESLEQVVGKERLFEMFDQATFMALDNWTALPHMSDIWRKMQKEICPKFSKKEIRRKIFFDLADPEFRLASDIAEAMDLISKFEQWFDVTLGLNQKESSEIAEVLAVKIPGKEGREFVQQAAAVLREKLGISGMVVHATAFAASASAKENVLLDGPFVQKPLISTGAGDHFNAGYSLGTILGGDLEQRLQIGVATSGYYVRTAISPTAADLRGFLKTIG